MARVGRRGSARGSTCELTLAQRANCREQDKQRAHLENISNERKRILSRMEEEMKEIRRDLRYMRNEVPEYFLRPVRPSSASVARTLSNGSSTLTTSCPRHGHTMPDKGQTVGDQENMVGNKPDRIGTRRRVRPATAHHTQTLSRAPNHPRAASAIGVQKVPISRSISSRSTEDRVIDLRPKTAGNQKWARKASIVKTLSQSTGQMKLKSVSAGGNLSVPARITDNKSILAPFHDFTASELDTITSINQWLGIKNAYEPAGIPPAVLRYVKNKYSDWNFDLDAFLAKQFPEPETAPIVSEEVIAKEKSNFKSFTATQALLKFKRRLAKYRAKSDDERRAERMWAELKHVRYLRIPGRPLEPTMSSSEVSFNIK